MARIQQDHFQIFVSHKHADREVAEAVKKELESLSPGSLRCWVSGHDIVAASDWRREIHHGLADSHLLLLLFTTPAHNWDWCLYEVGLFMRFDQADVRAVVCLFDPKGESPGPLANVQGVPADAASIHRALLTPLFKETWRVSDDWLKGPLDAGMDDGRLESAAMAIAESFAGSLGSDHYYPIHRIVLEFGGLDFDCDEGIPLDARVQEGYSATSGYTLSLFGRAEGPHPCTWGDILTAVGGDGASWRRQLDSQFAAACREELFDSMIEPFATWSRDRLYRPIITELNRKSGSRLPIGLTITLIRDLAPPIIGGPAFNLLRSNARFRSEVFDVYHGELSEKLASEGPAVYRAIAGAFRRVEREAEALGVFAEHEVRAAYGEDYASSGVRDLERSWLSARGRLEDALRTEDRHNTEEALAALDTLNHRFMTLAAERYSKVLAGDREGLHPYEPTGIR